jgi:hypothetical protein
MRGSETRNEEFCEGEHNKDECRYSTTHRKLRESARTPQKTTAGAIVHPPPYTLHQSRRAGEGAEEQREVVTTSRTDLYRCE